MEMSVVPDGPGAAGAGQSVEACNRIVAAVALEGVAEALTFARRSGVDPGRVREALLGGFAASKILEVQGKRMLEEDFRPGFPARLLQQELRVVLETAHRRGLALPGTALAAQHVNALVGGGDGDLDAAALIRVIQRLNEGKTSARFDSDGESRPLGEGEIGLSADSAAGDPRKQPRVGFIGLGVMGRPMALNLLRGGCDLRVYGRRPDSMKPLVEAGAVACGSPEEATRGCDVVFTMVTTTQDVQEVVLGERGVIAGARPGSVVVDMGTISPSATRKIAARLAEAGIEALDAPVSGGGTGAANATLLIMAGGKPEIFARVRPFFSHLGKSIVHVGPNSAGQVAKACNQVVMLATLLGLAEAFAFARGTGLDPQRVYESLSGGAAECRILEVMGKRMVERNYAAGIEARLHYKDLQIVLEECHTLGMALPGTALVTQMFNALIGRGGGTEDSSQLVEVIEGLSKGRQQT